MRPKHVLAAVAAVLCVFVVAISYAFWSGPSSSDSDVDQPPMRIGTLYWPGTFWVDIAREKGWFSEAGLSPQFVDANPDYYAALDALEQGNLDTITVWLFDVVKRNQRGAQLVMVLATDVSDGSEALVGAPHIHSVKQLKGARIGVALDTALVYELDVMLSRFALSLDDVTLVAMEPEQAAPTLAEGKVDAVMSWEPFVSATVEAGGIHLYDSSKLPGLMMGGMAFSERFTEDRPKDIQRLLKVWYRTTHFIKTNQDEAFAIVAEVNSVTPEEVLAFSKRNRIMDLRANITAFTYASGVESLYGSARKINRFLMSQEHVNSHMVEGTDFLDSRFLQELERNKGAL